MDHKDPATLNALGQPEKHTNYVAQKLSSESVSKFTPESE
jgi:hypothetical protein